jgi:hypothetical protein
MPNFRQEDIRMQLRHTNTCYYVSTFMPNFRQEDIRMQFRQTITQHLCPQIQIFFSFPII